MFGQFTHTQGSYALGPGCMAAAHAQIPSKTRKHSGSSLTVSTVLVSRCVLDVSFQRSSRADPPKYGSALTRILSSRNVPSYGTNSILVVSNWDWHFIIWARGLAILHDFLAKFCSSSCWPTSPVFIAVCSLPIVLVSHSCMFFICLRSKKFFIMHQIPFLGYFLSFHFKGLILWCHTFH